MNPHGRYAHPTHISGTASNLRGLGKLCNLIPSHASPEFQGVHSLRRPARNPPGGCRVQRVIESRSKSALAPLRDTLSTSDRRRWIRSNRLSLPLAVMNPSRGRRDKESPSRAVPGSGRRRKPVVPGPSGTGPIALLHPPAPRDHASGPTQSIDGCKTHRSLGAIEKLMKPESFPARIRETGAEIASQTVQTPPR